MQLLFYTILSFTGCILLAESVLFPRLDHQQNHGPLYRSVIQLLLQEKLRAEMILVESNNTINSNRDHIQQQLQQFYQQQFQLGKTLDELYSQSHDKSNCAAKFERDIAHLNRLLLDSYANCKLALEAALDQIQKKALNHLSYLRTAPIRIQSVRSDCNVTDLKHEHSNVHIQGSIIFCVLGKLGETDNYHYGTMRLAREFLLEVMDVTNDNCNDFENLKPEISYIQDEITECVKDL